MLEIVEKINFQSSGIFYKNTIQATIDLQPHFNKVSIPNPPLYRLKKNGLRVPSFSKSVFFIRFSFTGAVLPNLL